MNTMNGCEFSAEKWKLLVESDGNAVSENEEVL